MIEVRVWLFVLVRKRPAVKVKISPVHHSDYNEYGTSIATIRWSEYWNDQSCIWTNDNENNVHCYE